MSDNTIIAYQQLDKNDAHLFRLLGLLIEPEFGAEVVAIMMDTSLRTAKLSLERLARANLVEQMLNQRYRLLARASVCAPNARRRAAGGADDHALTSYPLVFRPTPKKP